MVQSPILIEHLLAAPSQLSKHLSPLHHHSESESMRYDDWDIILFPTGRDSKIPFKEFKVACNVVPDLELSHVHGPVGIPVMTCFVPSLLAGTAFQVSIHSWRKPDISQFTRTYSKNAEQVKFEARVMLDGRVAACVALYWRRNGNADRIQVHRP